ncbi:hypothetical protein Hanom_Chr16g01424191 [Helianthus anomalus]
MMATQYHFPSIVYLRNRRYLVQCRLNPISVKRLFQLLRSKFLYDPSTWRPLLSLVKSPDDFVFILKDGI